MPPNKHIHARKSERGNVFLFILLGVALFGALSFTIARGFHSDTTSTMSTRQAELAASDILNYAQRMERAVNRLRRKGCSENEISLQRDANGNGIIQDTSGDHFNSNAPTDKSCHIFHTDGTNFTYNKINGYDYNISGANGIIGIGCDGSQQCTELTFIIKNVDESLCEELNQKLNVTGIPTDTNGASGFSVFRGTFLNLASIGNTDANLAGQTSACYMDSDDNMFIFYHVMLVR